MLIPHSCSIYYQKAKKDTYGKCSQVFFPDGSWGKLRAKMLPSYSTYLRTDKE